MTLHPCRECGAEISANAPSCPNCGEPHPAESETVARQLQRRERGGAEAVSSGILQAVAILGLLAFAVWLVWRYTDIL